MKKNKKLIKIFHRDLALIEVRCSVVQDNELGINYDLVAGAQLFQGSLFEYINRNDCNVLFDVFASVEGLDQVVSFVLLPSEKATISLDDECIYISYDMITN